MLRWSTAVLLIFERGGKTVLYACDTGWFPDKTWQELENHRYDAVVLECTSHVMKECRRGHLSLAPFLEIKDRLDKKGLLKQDAPFIAQHIAHRHGDDDPTDQVVREKLSGHGVALAHDGMVVEI